MTALRTSCTQRELGQRILRNVCVVLPNKRVYITIKSDDRRPDLAELPDFSNRCASLCAKVWATNNLGDIRLSDSSASLGLGLVGLGLESVAQTSVDECIYN